MQRLSRLQVGNLFDRSYSYDAVGNVKTINDNTTTPIPAQSFAYDARDRLTSWTSGGTTQSYGYGTLGNLTNKAGVAYSYGTQSTSCPNGALRKPHAAVTVGGTSYYYDPNGNLVSGGGRTYAWNAENQLASVSQTSGSETYRYDGDGERVLVTRGSTTTAYLAGLWEEVVGGAVKQYYQFNGQVVAMRDSSTNSVTYLHGDHLGSVSLATLGIAQVYRKYLL
jgi:YD repeat-containing protein